MQIFSNFWKYLMIKRLFLGVPLSFPPKNWVFIQFSTNSTQLELPVFEFFRNSALVFSGFSLSFEFLGGLCFSKRKKSLITLQNTKVNRKVLLVWPIPVRRWCVARRFRRWRDNDGRWSGLSQGILAVTIRFMGLGPLNSTWNSEPLDKKIS